MVEYAGPAANVPSPFPRYVANGRAIIGCESTLPSLLKSAATIDGPKSLVAVSLEGNAGCGIGV